MIVFPFGQPNGEHRSNYMGNVNREDMIAAMRELIARMEGTYVEPSTAPPA